MRPALLERAVLSLAGALTLWSCYRALSPSPPRYPGPTRALMEQIDPSGDGKIDAGEYPLLSPPGASMETFDRDGDGALSERELETLILTVDPVWLVEAPH